MPASANTVVVALHVDTLPAEEVESQRVAAFVEALRGELERRAPGGDSAYGAAFSEGVRRVVEYAEGKDALAAQLVEWLVEAYEVDGATARTVVAGVMG